MSIASVSTVRIICVMWYLAMAVTTEGEQLSTADAVSPRTASSL